MSSVKFASGRERTVGRSLTYTTPIPLADDAYKGAIVAGEDGLMHYSTGTAWVALAPVLSTLIDAGNAETDYTGGARIDLGSAQP
jgi:hypothetical protein